MHRFLTAFLCLSTLALAQNVVAGTPTPSVAFQAPAIAELGAEADLVGVDAGSTRAAVGGEVPSPATMLLLVTGLAGLSAAGSPKRGARLPARL